MDDDELSSGPEAAPQSITVEPVVAFIGPLAHQTWAADFLRAAQALPPSADRFSPVAYYLCGHSIELALKAFLRMKGVPAKTLSNPRHFGHDLERLLDRALALGLQVIVDLSERQQQAIRVANAYYSVKLFEYLDGAHGFAEAMRSYPSLPDLDTLRSAAELLVVNLKEPCLNATPVPPL
jgi:hypothetical protein